MASAKRQKSTVAQRGKNFCESELKLLCYAYLDVSQDPRIGSGQRKDCFWERVEEFFEKHQERGLESRSQKSLETKWGDVRKNTTRFIACCKTVEDLNISGDSVEDTYRKAKELYKQRDKGEKEFTFDVCYPILKDAPRWMVPEDQMQKSKASTKLSSMGKRKSIDSSGMGLNESEAIRCDDEGSPGDKAFDTEPEVEQSENLGRAAPSRPVGSKIAKENAKKLKSKEDSFRISAQAQKVMAETSVERLRVLEGQTFMNMLLLPTEGLDHETLHFLNTWRKDSMSRLKARMTVHGESNVPPVAATHEMPMPVHGESIVPPVAAPMPSTGLPPDPWPPTAARSHLPGPAEDALPRGDEEIEGLFISTI